MLGGGNLIKGHINQITFASGLKVDLNKDSILILLGPNNSGKSATINDIKYLLSGQGGPSISLSDLSLIRESSLEDVRTLIGQPDSHGLYQLPGFGFHESNIKSWWESGRPEVGPFLTRQLVSDLATRARLGDCDPVPALDFRVPFSAEHPFQQMYRDPRLEDQTAAIFRRAFKQDLMIHRSAGNVIPGYVGARPKLKRGDTRDSLEYSGKIEKLALLEQQGDGIRSFVSIVARVITENRPIQLIDEPEAFLHPPQARLVAEAVAAHGGGRQTIVATHSSDIVQGLLSNHADRVSVVRLTRVNDKGSASYLAASRISELWQDPILRFSKVLDGLFHDGVIVTEADADCRFYEATANSSVSADVRPDIHYTYSGGKDRIPTVVAALTSLHVPVATIADFDVLNNDQPLKRIVEAHGATWDSVETDWKAIKLAVESKSAFVGGDEFRREIGLLLKQIPAGEPVPKSVLSKTKALAKRASPWENVKASGLAAVPSGGATVAAKRLLASLQSHGIFIAPLGEMEGFCRSIGGHGPRWVEEALKRNLATDTEFEDARRFMQSVVAYLNKKTKRI